MRGRKPKPTAVKKLTGNPGKRKLACDEPEFAPGAGAPPAHLDDEAKREWFRIAGELAPAGVLTQADRAALAVYCQVWARWMQAEYELVKHGYTELSPNGYLMPSPWLAICNKAIEQLRAFASEFGLTPSSRTRIHVAPPVKNEDPADAFFREVEAQGQTSPAPKLAG